MSTFSNTAREVEMPNGDIVKLHDGVTPNSTSNIKKFKYDDNGHVTESTAADAEDLNLSGYSTPTTGTTAIGTSDDVQTAIGKLDHQSHIDQTNILYSLDKVGKNLLNPYDTDVDYYDTNRGIVFTNNKDGSWHVAGTLVSGQTNAYVKLYEFTSGLPWGLQVGDVLTLATNSTKVSVTAIPITSGGYGTWVSGNATTQGTLTITSEFTGLLIRFLVETAGTVTNEDVIGMICHKEAWDQDSTIEKYGRPNYDLTQLESEDRAALAEVVDSGVKNLWNITLDSLKSLNSSGYTWNGGTATHTATGITFTVNSDMTITVNGTVGASNLVFNYGEISAHYNGYMLSSTPDTSTKYRTVVDNVGYDTGNGILLTNTVARNVKIELISNSSISNVTFKPMICTLADWKMSQKYAQYALPNYDLTQLQSEDRAALAEVVDSGAKNLFNIFTAAEVKADTITRTINADGTVTVSNSGTNIYTATLTYRISLVAGTHYVISGCPSGGSDNTYSLSIRTTSSQPIEDAIDYGSGSGAFTVSTSGEYVVYLRVAANYAFSDKIFKPMVCTKAAFDVSKAFVPYRPDYDTLVEKANKAQYTVQAANFACSAADTYEYTGLYVTVPAGHIYEILAYDYYWGASPTSIAIARNNTEISTFGTIVAESSSAPSVGTAMGVRPVMTVAPLISSSATYYLWVKHNSTSENKIALMYRQIV